MKNFTSIFDDIRVLVHGDTWCPTGVNTSSWGPWGLSVNAPKIRKSIITHGPPWSVIVDHDESRSFIKIVVGKKDAFEKLVARVTDHGAPWRFMKRSEK